jgi:oligopeptide/dipeptide ABC transporter ATP-binding protein
LLSKAEEAEQTAEQESGRREVKGCRFRGRCPVAGELCMTMEPQSREIETGHTVACHMIQLPKVELTHE